MQNKLTKLNDVSILIIGGRFQEWSYYLVSMPIPKAAPQSIDHIS